jgi:hypothetical protein
MIRKSLAGRFPLLVQKLLESDCLPSHLNNTDVLKSGRIVAVFYEVKFDSTVLMNSVLHCIKTALEITRIPQAEFRVLELRNYRSKVRSF